MRLTLLKHITLLALAACAPLALAEPPALVGRISGADGDVMVRSGGDSNSATLNWPITSDNLITTAPGAGAEFRVGSSAVRLAGDSELEVVELDEDSFKLRLHYGSVGVRVANPDMLSGFELETAQLRVLLRAPGRIRVDADREIGRAPGRSVVSVLAGEAELEGAGIGRLQLRAGKRAEVGDGDLRTGQLTRDAFDDWPDVRVPAPAALRYVGDGVTGYEELDRYGNWSDDAEYGPVWLPRAVPSGWAPYRDGRWSWVAPWGWTWIDNAPWGYAPSHYGRWVLLRQRWHWAPGTVRTRPVWAPALVGWVGGKAPSARPAGGGAHRPGANWFPLTPYQRYEPGYRISAERERRLNTRYEQRYGDGHADDWRARQRAAVTAPMPSAPTITPTPPAPAAPARPVPFSLAPPAIRTVVGSQPATLTTAPAPVAHEPAPLRHPGRERWERERAGRGEPVESRLQAQPPHPQVPAAVPDQAPAPRTPIPGTLSVAPPVTGVRGPIGPPAAREHDADKHKESRREEAREPAPLRHPGRERWELERAGRGEPVESRLPPHPQVPTAAPAPRTPIPGTLSVAPPATGVRGPIGPPAAREHDADKHKESRREEARERIQERRGGNNQR